MEARQAVDKLVLLIADDADPEVQEVAVWALGRIGGDVARNTLEACLESDNEALAVAAESSLDELNLFGDSLLMYDFGEESDDGFIELYSDDLGGATDDDSPNGQG